MDIALFLSLKHPKLDKILSKVTKEICNIPNSTTNILRHLSNEYFGIGTTSLLSDYVSASDNNSFSTQ